MRLRQQREHDDEPSGGVGYCICRRRRHNQGVTTASGSGLTAATAVNAETELLHFDENQVCCGVAARGNQQRRDGPITGEGGIGPYRRRQQRQRHAEPEYGECTAVAANNTFTGNQTVNGNLTATGFVSGGTISASASNGAYAVTGNDASSSGSIGVAGISTNGTGVYGNGVTGTSGIGVTYGMYATASNGDGIAAFGPAPITAACMEAQR